MAGDCYKIKDWESVWENYRSREVAEVRYVSLPVRRKSEARIELMLDDNGLAAFGLFILAVEIAACCPVRGVLADDKGPLTPKRIALRIGRPVAQVEALHGMLVACGWLVPCEIPAQRPHAPVPPGAPADSANHRPVDAAHRPVGTASMASTPEGFTGSDRNGLDGNGPDRSARGAREPRPGDSSEPQPGPAPAEKAERMRWLALGLAGVDGEARTLLSECEELPPARIREEWSRLRKDKEIRDPKRALVANLCREFGITLAKKGASA